MHTHTPQSVQGQGTIQPDQDRPGRPGMPSGEKFHKLGGTFDWSCCWACAFTCCCAVDVRSHIAVRSAHVYAGLQSCCCAFTHAAVRCCVLLWSLLCGCLCTHTLLCGWLLWALLCVYTRCCALTRCCEVGCSGRCCAFTHAAVRCCVFVAVRLHTCCCAFTRCCAVVCFGRCCVFTHVAVHSHVAVRLVALVVAVHPHMLLCVHTWCTQNYIGGPLGISYTYSLKDIKAKCTTRCVFCVYVCVFTPIPCKKARPNVPQGAFCVCVCLCIHICLCEWGPPTPISCKTLKPIVSQGV